MGKMVTDSRRLADFPIIPSTNPWDGYGLQVTLFVYQHTRNIELLFDNTYMYILMIHMIHMIDLRSGRSGQQPTPVVHPPVHDLFLPSALGRSSGRRMARTSHVPISTVHFTCSLPLWEANMASFMYFCYIIMLSENWPMLEYLFAGFNTMSCHNFVN